jgi:hypothetical protein
VDALAGALPGRVEDLQPQLFGNVGPGTGAPQQLAGRVLDIGQPVDVQLEHFGRVLGAQPVAGAQILVHPDPQRLAHDNLPCSLSTVQGRHAEDLTQIRVA